MIRDADVHHMLRDRKTRPLPRAWLRELPTRLRSPSAVLMDRTSCVSFFLYIPFCPLGGRIAGRGAQARCAGAAHPAGRARFMV